MNSKFIIKPTDTRGEIRLKLEQRLQYFTDSKYTDGWLYDVCSSVCVDECKSRAMCLNIPNMDEFVSQIRDECLKGPMNTEFCVSQVVKHFLAINKHDDGVSWNRAGDYKIDSSGSARFIKWLFNVPMAFREIAEPFFTQDYSTANGGIAVIDYVWGKIDRDVPKRPYQPAPYDGYCDKLYEPFDTVEECPMLEYLTFVFGERSHTLTAKYRVNDVSIERLKKSTNT